MAANFADSPEGLIRTSGLVPASSDCTAIWMDKLVSSTAGGVFQTRFIRVNGVATYTQYVWIGTSAGGHIGIDVDGTFASQAISTGRHWLAYVLEGTTHKLFVDGVLAAQVTVDVSGHTFSEQYLGTDTFPAGWTAGEASHFFEFNFAMTPAQIIAQMHSVTAIVPAWAATPLATDLLDDSGNGRDWSESGGTIAFVAQPPTNISPGSAVEITTLPHSQTYLTTSNDEAMWFKRTALTPDGNYLCAFAGVDAVSGFYTPKIRARKKSGSSYPLLLTTTPTAWRSLTIPHPPGQETYLEILSDDAGLGTPTRNLVLSVAAAPTESIEAGDLFISRDAGTAATHQSTFLNPETGAIKRLLPDMPGSETGALLSDGTLALGHGIGFDLQGDQEIQIFDSDFQLLAETAIAVGTVNAQRHPPIAARGMTFWFAQHRYDNDPFNLENNPIRIVSFNKFGAVQTTRDIDLPTTWLASTAFLDHLNVEWGVGAIALSPDSNILYLEAGFPSGFLGNFGGAFDLGGGMEDCPIARWDLVNDVALPDLNTIPAGYMNFGLQVLTSGQILVQEDPHEIEIGTDDFHVLLYNPDGSVAQTYTFESSIERETIAQLALARDEASFFCWFQGRRGDAGTGSLTSEILRVRISDGAILASLPDIPGLSSIDLGNAYPEGTATPDHLFGLQASCQLLVLGAAVSAPGQTGVIGPLIKWHFSRRVIQ